MQAQGGMYNLLGLILAKLSTVEFTTKELSKMMDLSEDAISKNLSRLVKVGILERHEKWVTNTSSTNGLKPRGKCRFVTYKIKGDMIDFVRRTLYC